MSSQVLEMFQNGKFVKCCAPMVRYSKLPFRMLTRRYKCDVAFTPMIVSSDFVASDKCRQSEFITNEFDRPLITQFAAKDPIILGQASEYVAGHCDAVDINCGCPQRWVMRDGYGGGLLKKPELVKDMVSHVYRMSNLPVSIKIRIDHDLQKTYDLVTKAEAAGVSWITVHGRTVDDKSTVKINYDGIKFVKETVNVPVMGNGHCYTLKDVAEMREKTGVNGILSARGLLANPGLFAGFTSTTENIVTDFLDLSLATGLRTNLIHQHLIYMLYDKHTKVEKSEFNSIKSIPGILNFFSERNYNFSNVTPGELSPDVGEQWDTYSHLVQ
jgi:tRNA-dihydrouridine synthase 4